MPKANENAATPAVAVETAAPTKKKRAPKAKAKAKATAKKTAAKAKKATAPKTAKKTAKQPATPADNGQAQYGVDRSHDLPWNNKKVAVFKALKSLRATSATDARSAKDVAEKASVTARDVRHYCYHAKAAGLTGVAELDGMHGYGFYLTAKGRNVDPAKALKEQTSE